MLDAFGRSRFSITLTAWLRNNQPRCHPDSLAFAAQISCMSRDCTSDSPPREMCFVGPELIASIKRLATQEA